MILAPAWDERVIYEQWLATENENAVLSTIVPDIHGTDTLEDGEREEEFSRRGAFGCQVPHLCNTEWSTFGPEGLQMVRNQQAASAVHLQHPAESAAAPS